MKFTVSVASVTRAENMPIEKAQHIAVPLSIIMLKTY
jgi:hypothetical protein